MLPAPTAGISTTLVPAPQGISPSVGVNPGSALQSATTLVSNGGAELSPTKGSQTPSSFNLVGGNDLSNQEDMPSIKQLPSYAKHVLKLAWSIGSGKPASKKVVEEFISNINQHMGLKTGELNRKGDLIEGSKAMHRALNSLKNMIPEIKTAACLEDFLGKQNEHLNAAYNNYVGAPEPALSANLPNSGPDLSTQGETRNDSSINTLGGLSSQVPKYPNSTQKLSEYIYRDKDDRQLSSLKTKLESKEREWQMTKNYMSTEDGQAPFFAQKLTRLDAERIKLRHEIGELESSIADKPKN